MKTTDNQDINANHWLNASKICRDQYRELEAQRDALQTELGNTQFALEEMAAQRDAAVAALRDLTTVIRVHGTTAARSIPMENAYKVIAAAESEGQ